MLGGWHANSKVRQSLRLDPSKADTQRAGAVPAQECWTSPRVQVGSGELFSPWAEHSLKFRAGPGSGGRSQTRVAG